MVSRPSRSSASEMAERKFTSISLQKFTELEELAEEIMGDKHQVKDYNMNVRVLVSEQLIARCHALK